jgi:hypothetical protein
MDDFPWAAIVVFAMAMLVACWVHLFAYNVAMSVVKIVFGG